MATLNDMLIRSNQGMAYYKDKNSGRILKLIEARRIEASINTDIHDYLPLGTLVTKHYPGSMSISGTMELYMCSSFFLKQMELYKLTGTPFYFNLQIINGTLQEQGTVIPMNAGIGFQSVTLIDVLLSTTPITTLGTDTEGAYGTFNFTANDYQLEKEFNEVQR